VDFRPLALQYDADSSTLAVAGSVDESSGTLLRAALEKYSDGYSYDLVVDLGDIDFLPSLGIGVLAVAMRTANERGASIELVAVEGTVAQRVLAISGMPHRLR
jgi:anti-anti-sigma factor